MVIKSEASIVRTLLLPLLHPFTKRKKPAPTILHHDKIFYRFKILTAPKVVMFKKDEFQFYPQE